MALLMNNVEVQRGRVGLMIFEPEELLNEVKSFMSLEDGLLVEQTWIAE